MTDAERVGATPPLNEEIEMSDAEAIAREFHAAYEALAPSVGYRTRKASAVPWEQVPEYNRALMVATVDRLLRDHLIDPGPGLGYADEARERFGAPT